MTFIFTDEPAADSNQWFRNYSLRKGECQWLRSFPVLGQEFRKARLRAGLTQESLAAKARLTREYVSLLELNKRMPTIPVYIRLCKALGISPSELMVKLENAGHLGTRR